MDAVSFLEKYHKNEILILNKQTEVEKWRKIAESLGGFQMSERVQSSGSQSKTADAIAEYADYEAEIKRLREQQKDILNVIESLAVDEYKMLYKVYVLTYSIPEVANEERKSYSWGYKTHSKALRSVQNVLNDRKVKEST